MSCEVLNKIGTGDCEQDTNRKVEQNYASVIASDLVSDILDDALDIVEDIEQKVSLRAVEDILEGLQSKFQSEAKVVPLKGLGDQLEPDEGIGEESLVVKQRPVEKKSRLTDLVKNSKQMLAKLIQNETKENGQEKVIRVVELDSGDQPYKIQKKTIPEQPTEDGCKEETMDEIKLCSSRDKSTQKGEVSVRTKKTMTFPMASTSGKHLSLAARYRTLKFPTELKTKKWNIGTKIVNYIRKHQSKKTGKEGERQASDGVEFVPKNEDN